MSKFDDYANHIDAQVEVGTSCFGGALAGSLPVDSRRFSQVSISSGGFTSTDSLGFFTGRFPFPRSSRYKIKGEVINVKCNA